MTTPSLNEMYAKRDRLVARVTKLRALGRTGGVGFATLVDDLNRLYAEIANEEDAQRVEAEAYEVHPVHEEFLGGPR